jgi:hypothetical protein
VTAQVLCPDVSLGLFDQASRAGSIPLDAHQALAKKFAGDVDCLTTEEFSMDSFILSHGMGMEVIPFYIQAGQMSADLIFAN